MIQVVRSAALRAALALAALASPLAAQVVWYVDGDAPIGGSGLSWAQAFNSLDKGLRVAETGDSVWVAEGVYRPSSRTDASDPRSATFFVPQGVAVYGGFAGHELSLDQRAGLFRTTILDGDIGTPGDASDNAYHVVRIDNPSGIPPGFTRVDGFTIAHGNADVPGSGQGGGVHSFNSATILANCHIVENRALFGGGVHAQPGLIRLVRCNLTDNHALINGGAIWGQAVNIYAVHCTFARNRSEERGGAVFLHSISSPEAVHFVGCLFHENVADTGGAAFLGGGQFASGKATFLGCTFSLNSAATSGGGLRAITGVTVPAVSRIYGSIVWRNFAPQGPELQGQHQVSYSNVMGGAAGPGNIASDPRFVSLVLRDFRLAAGSPCIDAGDNAFVPADVLDVDGDGDTTELLPWDLARRPRIQDDPATPDTGSGTPPIVDMGAYEYQP